MNSERLERAKTLLNAALTGELTESDLRQRIDLQQVEMRLLSSICNFATKHPLTDNDAEYLHDLFVSRVEADPASGEISIVDEHTERFRRELIRLDSTLAREVDTLLGSVLSWAVNTRIDS